MIHQSVTLPEVDLTHSDNDKGWVKVPHGLKQRWKPFGYSKFNGRWKGAYPYIYSYL